MTATVLSADLPVATATSPVARIAAAVRARLARMRERHDRRTLLACEDHLLRDIGVSRADLESDLRYR